MATWERDGFYDYLDSGFVVIGSQYRGNDSGEGHDEEGGAEVRDVLNLFPLGQSLGYLDMGNVFMIRDSCGAMMTYLAMQDGIGIKAAAVVGAETDLGANVKRRPELLEGYREHIPDFDSRTEESLRRRSAIFWPEYISAPLLMMHGGKDWHVPPAQDLAFASKLETLRKPYELIVFDGDTPHHHAHPTQGSMIGCQRALNVLFFAQLTAVTSAFSMSKVTTATIRGSMYG